MPSNYSSLESFGIKLPYSIEAEQAVLGAIIVNQNVYSDIVDIVTPAHFYSKQNADIFSAIGEMKAAGIQVDFVSLLDRVERSNIFENKEQAKVYLYDISQTVPSITNVSTYAKIVYDKFLARTLLTASSEIIDEVNNTELPAEQLLDFAEQKIDDIRFGRDKSAVHSYQTALLDLMTNLTQISGPDAEKYKGIKTGYRYLDNVLSGLKKQNLVILAARPAIGKTSLALNICSNVAKNYPDRAVIFFSLEMSARLLAERITSYELGIPLSVFQTGTSRHEITAKLFDYSDTAPNKNIFFDDTSSVTVPEIKAKARRIKNLGLVVVDYLQLMNSAKRIDNRVQEISEITRAFKIMAKELDVPVLLLSQLSRSNEKEKNRRPVLSDLRDSGSIEQDADVVMFLHREKLADNTYAENHDLIVAKNRHGATITVPLGFDGEHTRFYSIEPRTDNA